MVLDHHVPAARLTRRYFRRWWYWKGVSRARLHRLHPETETGLDLRTVPRISGVPRFVLGEMASHARGLAAGLLKRDRTGAAEEEMMLMYSLGYFREAWRTRREPAAGGGESASPDDSRLARDSRS